MKLKQILALAALAVGSSAWAQQEWTDVTSKITNPSFETDNAIADLTTCGWATDRVTGWTILPASASNSQVGVGNSSSKIQGIGSSSNTSAGEKYFYTRNNWNADTNFSIEQIISSNLPAGFYMLTCKIKTSSSDPSKTKWTLSLQEGGKPAVTNTNAGSAAEWINIGVLVNKESDDTNLTIKANMLPGNSASSQHYVMMIDDVQLKYLSSSDMSNVNASNPLDVSGVIYNAQIYNANKTNMPRGWTAFKSTRGNSNFTEATGDTRLEGWSGGNLDIDYYQQIAGLPAGKYRLTATCGDSNDRGAYAYIYNDGTGEKVTVDMNQAASDITTPSINVAEGNAINIGIAGDDLRNGSWVTGDNFRLEYLASGIDLTEWNKAVNNAETALGQYDEKYATTERAAVVDAKAVIPTTDEEVTSKTNDLNDKVAEYTKKAANEKLIEDNKPLTDAIARIKTEYPNSSDEVLNTDLSKWNKSTYVVMSAAEHWSGVNPSKYYEQSSAQWGQNSWSIYAEHTVNLPVGKYAFVVTARAAAETTSKMTINGEEIELCHKGSAGYGIATNGEATFDMSKTFANNGAGRGWEYAYAEFELTEAKDVTFRFDASTSTVHNWVSIANPVLYYNDDAKEAMELVRKQAVIDQIAGVFGVEDVNVPSGKMTADIATTLNDAVNAAKAGSTSNTVEELNELKASLETAITAAKASVDAYAALKAALDYYCDRSAAFTTEFTYRIEAQTMYDEATAATADVNKKANDMLNEYRAYVKNIAESYNATVQINWSTYGEGWEYTTEATNHGQLNNPVNNDISANSMWENWKDGGLALGDMKQVVKVPTGKYFLKMVSFTRKSPNADDYIYIKSGSIEETSVSIGDAGKPNGFRNITNPIEVTNGEVEIGLHIGSGADWAAIGGVELHVMEVDDYPRSTASGKYGTICLPYEATVEGAKIYSAEINENKTLVTLTEVEGNLVAGTPYIYQATADAQTFSYASGNIIAAPAATSPLVGVFTPTPVPVDSYVLQTQTAGQKFYIVAEGKQPTLSEYKAYLTVPATAGAKALSIGFAEETAIKAIDALMNGDAKIYDMNGRELKSLQKGVNIVNGVKVLVK